MEAHTVGNSIPRVIITTRKSTLKNIVFGCVVRSEHRIDTLNAISIGEEYLNIFMTERFIEKTVCFWGDPIKKFRRSHKRCSIKKLLLKIPQYSQENTCVGVCFHLHWSTCDLNKKRLLSRCFLVRIRDILRTTFSQNTSGRLLLEVESENISQW